MAGLRVRVEVISRLGHSDIIGGIAAASGQGERGSALADPLGGVESLIEPPAIMPHATIPPAQRARLRIGDTLIRLSVGIEDVSDLRADLARGLAAART